MSEYLQGIAQPAKHFKRLGAWMNFLWFHAWRLKSKPYASDPFCTTILGYCSRTKVKSCLILRRFYATWLLALTLGLKCYYLWELYPPWVLVNTLVLSTNVARSTMSLVWIKKKAKTKTKTVQVHLLSYQSGHVCVRLYYDSLCQILLRDLKTYPWRILYLQLLSRLSLIMLCLSKNLIPLLYIISLKFLKTIGELKP